jgi:hypothetical protein
MITNLVERPHAALDPKVVEEVLLGVISHDSRRRSARPTATASVKPWDSIPSLSALPICG